MSNEKNYKNETIFMIVNGQPIEMCPKTLNMCNKRAQKMITALKSQSLEKVHTMRLFWGDVIMLNIITNQLLQKVDSRSLSRVLKPVNSLEEDLEEYRETRKAKVEKLKDALVVANDSTLPLDYSRELEKYFHDTPVEEDTEELTIEKITTPTIKTNDDEQKKKKPQSNIQKRDKKVSTPVQKSSTLRNKNIYRSDDSEEEVDFSTFSQNLKSDSAKSSQNTTKPEKTQEITPKKESNEPDIKQKQKPFNDIIIEENEELNIDLLFETKKSANENEDNKKSEEHPNKNEFEKHQEAFTSFGSLDLDSLFG